MYTLLLLIVLIAQAATQQQTTVSPLPSDGSLVSIVAYKWMKSHVSFKKAEQGGVTPMRAVIPENKILQRNARANQPVGVRDPNADTVDGRSAEMDRIVQESRTTTKDVEGYSFYTKIHNNSSKAIETIFWEYQFTEAANPTNVARRQFLCAVDIKGGKEKELESFSTSGPIDVVSVKTLEDKNAKESQERVVINRVEYTDGSMWQRPGWHLAEVKANFERVVKEPWTPGMCKAL
jgi:hypothetical protein